MEDTILDKGIDTGEALRPIEPLQGRWQFLWISITAAMVPIAIETWLVVEMIGIFSRLLEGDVSGQARFMELYGIEKTLMPFFYLFAVVSIVAVCMWVHRATKNLGSAGLKLIEFSPGMAVGYFFIPVANWFFPFKVMKEIDKGSQSLSSPAERTSWVYNRFNQMLLLWFIPFVVSAVLLIYLTYKAKSLENNNGGIDAVRQFIMVAYLYAITYTLRIISGIALIFYTRKITRQHNAHITMVNETNQ